MKQSPRVSVIIPAFNAEMFIERCLRSASNQTLKPIEIIVIDDASTDGTSAVVSKLAREIREIRLIHLGGNAGPSKARNTGISVATGDWVAVLDADDAMKPQRLQVLWDLAERTSSQIVADNLTLYDAGASREVRAGFHSEVEEVWLTPLTLFQSELYESSSFGFGLVKPMFNRRTLLDNELVYDESQRYGEDTALLASCLLKGLSCVISSEPNYIYTTRIGELSGKLSSFSRSSPRFDLIVGAMKRLERTFGDEIDQECRLAMWNLIQFQTNIHKSNVLRGYRKQRRYLKFAWSLCKDPSLVAFLGRRTSRRVKTWALSKSSQSVRNLEPMTVSADAPAPASTSPSNRVASEGRSRR
jgi:succinoglycan biosynthesis protein ExoO